MAERSLELDPLLSTIWVLSSTVSVIRSPCRELITMLLLSESTFDTRPTADFRFAELLAARSVEPRDPEVPTELSLGAVPPWPYVDPVLLSGVALELLEPVLGLFWPYVEPLDPVPPWP